MASPDSEQSPIENGEASERSENPRPTIFPSLVIECDKTSCGIPEAIFLSDVDAFMQKPGNENAEEVLKRLEEQHQKYKFMEQNLHTKRFRLLEQHPDIKTSLEHVKMLQHKRENDEEFISNVLIADNVYVKVSVPPLKCVNLWLGANVMIEYPLDEAEGILVKNLNAASNALEETEKDLSFLRDQTTTIEVNMARVYNWDVTSRQNKKKEEEG